MGKRQYEGGGSKGWGRGSMREEVVRMGKRQYEGGGSKDGEEAV